MSPKSETSHTIAGYKDGKVLVGSSPGHPGSEGLLAPLYPPTGVCINVIFLPQVGAH